MSTEERNLLSVAYKHVVSSRRTSWRALNSDESQSNSLIQEYRHQLEEELSFICHEVLALLEDHLIPAQRRIITLFETKLNSLVVVGHDETGKKAAVLPETAPNASAAPNPTNTAASGMHDPEPQSLTAGAVLIDDTDYFRQLHTHKEGLVFYLKLCGDYYRYLAEFLDAATDSPGREKARCFYDEAYTLAKSRLTGTHTEVLARTNPVRLGLALNYSVCYYEILEEKEQACTLAREAFNEAVAQLDNLDDHQFKDSTLILMLLRDNLTLWSDTPDSFSGWAPGYEQQQQPI